MFKKISQLLSNEGFRQRYSAEPAVNESFNFLALIEKWEEVVGPRLAEHTIPLKNRNKTLTILSNHPAYGQQLSFMEKQLIKKITDAFPPLNNKIDRIIFQTNSSFFEERKKMVPKAKKQVVESTHKYHKYSPELKKLEKEADSLLQEIDDAEIRESLKSIFIQGRQEGTDPQ